MSALRARYRQFPLDNRAEQAVSYPVLFWLFITGSLLGFVFEGMFHLIRKGSWAFRVGTLWGPFCVLYGFGMVVMYLVALAVRQKNPLIQFAVFALTGSAVELLAGVFQKVCFGTQSWNYSGHALNLGGYISLRMTFLWGVAGMALMYVILPLIFQLFSQLRLGQRTSLCRMMSVFMCVNLLLTAFALIRWQERVQTNAPASNAIEAYMDRRWPDDRMRERFPNMEFVGSTESPES